VGEWRPIETEMPKGQDTLVVFSDGSMQVAKWDAGCDDHLMAFGDGLPTHWMPLPAPPQEADRG
jgi:hypothetical protein